MVSFAYENGLAEAMIILIANTNDKHRCFMCSLSFFLFANQYYILLSCVVMPK